MTLTENWLKFSDFYVLVFNLYSVGTYLSTGKVIWIINFKVAYNPEIYSTGRISKCKCEPVFCQVTPTKQYFGRYITEPTGTFNNIGTPTYLILAFRLSVNLSVLGTGLGLAWPSPVLVKLRNATETVLSQPLTEEQGSWVVSIGFLTGILGKCIKWV